jgi:DNA primase
MFMFVKPSSSQIRAWVDRFFPDRKIRKNGEEIDINNPLNVDDGRHLGISTKKAICHDWRPNCGDADGSFIRFVMKYRKVTLRDAIKEVCGGEVSVRELLNPNEGQEQEAEEIESIKLPPSAVPFESKEGGKIRQIALNYLIGRGISENLAIQKHLMFDVSGIIFPYFEYGALVYWQKRSVLNKRFEFPDNSLKSHFLYGFDDVEPCTEVIVTESIFNALSLGKNAMASGGASLDNGGMQIRKILALRPERVILAPDNDRAGIESLRNNFFLLESHFQNRIWYSIPPKIQFEGGVTKDWNDIGKAKGWDKVRQFFIVEQLDQSVLFRLAEQGIS